MNEKKDKDVKAAAKEKDPAENTEKKDNSKVFLLCIMVGMILINAIAAFVLIKITRPKSSSEIGEQLKADSMKAVASMATKMGATTADMPIEAIVNIAGTDGARFLKAAVIFEYDDKEYPDLVVELQRRVPKFKDMLIDHLSKLTLIEVTEPDAKNKIRKDLLAVVNKSLPSETGSIRDVFFTTYIIQ